MQYNPIYTYKKLDRQDGGAQGRVYVDEAGNGMPSVTTILSATKDMEHLIAWRKRVGEDNANRISAESAGWLAISLQNYGKFLIWTSWCANFSNLFQRIGEQYYCDWAQNAPDCERQC